MRSVLLLLWIPLACFSQTGATSSRGPAGQPAPQAAPETPQEPGSLEGSVVSAATGEPVKKAVVMLMRVDQIAGPQVPFSASTDAAGRYTFRDIPPGNYRLIAERAGFVRVSYGARTIMRPGATLNIRPGQKVTGIDFKLTPQGVITGRVLDEDGEPVMNVSVQALRYAYMQGRRRLLPAGQSMTNDLGEYRIHSLAPGKYFLSAIYRATSGYLGAVISAEPDEGYAPTYYPGTNDPASAVPLEVIAGNPQRGTDIRLLKTRTMRIRGRVVSSFGSGATRQMGVTIMHRDSAFLGLERNFAGVQPDGRFELRGVIPGSYLLVANYWDGSKGYFARQPIEVGNANIDGVTLTVEPGIEISGKIRMEGGAPGGFENLHVSLQPRDFSPMFGGGGGPVKEDGSFTLQNLGPEIYTFNVFGPMQDAYLKSVRLGDQDVLASGLDLTGGASGTLDAVLSPNGGQVEGSVTNAKGEAVAGATVALVPDSARAGQLQLYKSASTDQYGHFQLRGIAPGEYKLYAWEEVDFGAWQDPEFLKPFEGKAESLTIREGGREHVQPKLIPAAAETPGIVARD